MRDKVLEGVAELLAAGDDLTFARVAAVSGVPERTIYRHFATRQALLAAVFDWANERIGFSGGYPTDGEGLVALIRRVFPGFDTLAPVIRELLVDPDGLPVRLADNEERQRAALAIVDTEAPGLDPASARRVAATLQLLTAASSWQTLRDYWDMDGEEAAEASALAVELLLQGARTQAQRPSPTRPQPRRQGGSRS